MYPTVMMVDTVVKNSSTEPQQSLLEIKRRIAPGLRWSSATSSLVFFPDK
jgi:hypothetical protein